MWSRRLHAHVWWHHSWLHLLTWHHGWSGLWWWWHSSRHHHLLPLLWWRSLCWHRHLRCAHILNSIHWHSSSSHASTSLAALPHHQMHDLLEHLHDFGILEKLHAVPLRVTLLLIGLEVSSILNGFDAGFSDLLDFIVINEEISSVEGLVAEHLFCIGGTFRTLEANKSMGLLAFRVSKELNVFNFSIFSKQILEVFLFGIRLEVLNVEIASLFRVFEL